MRWWWEIGGGEKVVSCGDWGLRDDDTRVGGRFHELQQCEKPEKAVPKAKQEPRRYVPPPGSSRWMDHFHLPDKQAWKARREATAPLRSPSGLPTPR